MRHLLFVPVLLVATTALAAPEFRPLDPAMIVAPPAAPVVTAPTPMTPPPAVITAPSAEVPLAKARDGETIESIGSGAIPSLPLQLMTQNGISYISGGVSDEESDQLKAQENEFNLRVQVTGQNGEYLSNVMLTVKGDGDQPLLTLNDAGPYIFIKAPPGKYWVEVTAQGMNKSVNLLVPESGAVRTQLRFPIL